MRSRFLPTDRLALLQRPRDSLHEFLRFQPLPRPTRSDARQLPHLLRELPRPGLAAYHGQGGHRVEFVRYAPADASIAINKTQSFRPVRQAVWEFRIGGYQILDKYLKSRKGRVLSLDEITHVSAVADSLAFTIDQMERIDIAYRAAFPEQS